MGKHSTHQQADFVKSTFMWFLPWLLAAVVGLGALWIAIDAAFGGDADGPVDPPPQRGAAAGASSPTTSPSSVETPEAEETASPAEPEEGAGAPNEKRKKKGKKELISRGVPVQVLNGTSLPDADDRVARDLEELGFEIVATNAWHATPATVVYWATDNDEEAATLLAEKFGWSAQPKPEELSTEVRLHVLVGADATVD
jgi:hypothetical protein